MTQPTSLRPEGIEAFCRLLEAESGLHYEANKAYLFESRLRALVAQEGLQDYWGLCRLWQAQQSRRQPIVEALLTSETYFFRDPGTFEVLPTLLPWQSASQQRPLKVWSVGCSSGQEAVSLAIGLDEVGLPPSALEVLGLDLSPSMVAKAEAATYTAFEVSRGLSEARLQRCFEAHEGAWRLRQPWRQPLRYRVINVVHELPPGGDLDLIMVRNLLIYLSDENRQRLLLKLADRLKPGGLLVMGNSEHAQGITWPMLALTHTRASIHQRLA